MIIPTIPTLAQLQIKDWNGRGLQAFHRIVEPMTDNDCQNCGGLGVVYVQFAKAGPFPAPNGGVVTYHEGDGAAGKGFYAVDRTEAYKCDKCGGTGNER